MNSEKRGREQERKQLQKIHAYLSYHNGPVKSRSYYWPGAWDMPANFKSTNTDYQRILQKQNLMFVNKKKPQNQTL